MIKANMAYDDIDKLRLLNEDRINSLIQKNWERLSDLLSPQLIFIHSSGRFEGKDSYLQSLMDGKLQYLSIEMPEPKIFALDTGGVVRGPLSTGIVSNGQARILHSYAHMTWICNSQNGWQLLSYSSTPTQ